MDGTYDVAIVGGGMAGASLAYFLSADTRAVILEAEDAPGYHTTGRSAAFYFETYGGPPVVPLTVASRAFLDAPPPGFAQAPLLRPMGALHVAHADRARDLDALLDEYAGTGVVIEPLDAAAVREQAPLLRPEWATRALYERSCADMDVGELHRAFLAGARRRGAALRTGARVAALAREGAGWRIETAAGAVRAGVVVNAAGAWADAVAALAGARPLGIAPLRRTVAQVAVEPGPAPDMPMLLDAAGEWYVKREGARLWVSPHDETPDAAGDVQPDELDVAVALDRFERAFTARVTRLERAWAGLRAFAPDRAPVYGWDADAPGLFWCAGQGGFGIQTAPAAGMLGAALVEGRALPEPLLAAGVDAGRYAPGRFAPVAAAVALG